MMDADLVLMDEPFSALDAVTRHELQALAYELLQDKTVLLITHDPQEALRLSDDIYVLKHQPATISLKITPDDRPIRALTIAHLVSYMHGSLLSLGRLSDAMAQDTFDYLGFVIDLAGDRVAWSVTALHSTKSFGGL